MIFKSSQVELEYRGAPLLLKFMCQDFDGYSRLHFGIEPVLTRVLEDIPGSSGVHEDYRGADFRDEFNGVRTYTDAQVKDFLTYMNDRYFRNDGKPSMIHHSFRGAPYHFHLQISLFTKAYMPR